MLWNEQSWVELNHFRGMTGVDLQQEVDGGDRKCERSELKTKPVHQRRKWSVRRSFHSAGWRTDHRQCTLAYTLMRAEICTQWLCLPCVCGRTNGRISPLSISSHYQPSAHESLWSSASCRKMAGGVAKLCHSKTSQRSSSGLGSGLKPDNSSHRQHFFLESRRNSEK